MFWTNSGKLEKMIHNKVCVKCSTSRSLPVESDRPSSVSKVLDRVWCACLSKLRLWYGVSNPSVCLYCFFVRYITVQIPLWRSGASLLVQLIENSLVGHWFAFLLDWNAWSVQWNAIIETPASPSRITTKTSFANPNIKKNINNNRRVAK